MLLLSLVTFSYPKGSDSSPATNETGRSIFDAFHSLDGYFIENRGQVADGIRYYSRGNPSVGFRDDGVMFLLTEVEKEGRDEIGRWKDPMPLSNTTMEERVAARSYAYIVRFESSNKVTPVGMDELPFKSNFFIGNDPGGWRTDVPNYREVIYRNLYDGTDLIYHPALEGVKYEFVVHPGADPGVIGLAYDGVESLRLDGGGTVAEIALGEVRDSPPVAFQRPQDTIRCTFSLRTSLSYGFDCEQWDRSSPLIIDPLVYSTYLGGSYRDDVYSMAVDSTGNAYVTGFTGSPDFPATPGSYCVAFNGFSDVFVSKLNQNGSDLIYSTFLGGKSQDIGSSIALDSQGHAYVVGVTLSENFPTTPGSFDTSYTFGYEAFVSKLSYDGSSLVYSSFLGGLNWDQALAVVVDANGSAFVTGFTYSSDFPVTPGAYDTTFNYQYSGADVFITKMDADGSVIVYSTFLGGGHGDGGNSIAIDALGNAYVAGGTMSDNFPTTADAFDATYNGLDDAFVSKLNTAGSVLVYSTFLGGSDQDEGESISIDSYGNAYITGGTFSSDFPVTPGAFDTTFDGGSNYAFVAKLNASGSTLDYSTLLGPTEYYGGRSIFVDAAGSAYVTGGTMSGMFPTTPGAFSTNLSGIMDAFATRMNADGSDVEYSTLLGGGSGEQGRSIVVDATGVIYIAGNTVSDDFPVTPDAFDRSYNGDLSYPGDAFVTKLALPALNRPPIISSFTATLAPEGMPVILTVNASDLDGDILTYYFDFDSDGTFDASGLSNTASHVWGDDYKGFATVSVSDGRLFTEANTTVVVYNVPPSIRPDVAAGVTGDLTLRVAGEKWHDVELTVYRDGVAVADASVTRFPGSPDDQAATIENFTIDLLEGNLSAVVRYTPDDDPINGQPNGANPAWLTFTAKDGSESRLHHTFNVRHNETWTWKVDDLRVLLAGMNITFTATATDAGSDDLTFTWDWGDGSPATARTYYNDGTGPDPYPSPGGTFPFTATDSHTHAYSMAGTHSIIVRVTDDDGGMEEILLVIVLV